MIVIHVVNGARPFSSDLRGLLALKAEYGRRLRGGLLMHDGERSEWLAEGVLAVPWWRVV